MTDDIRLGEVFFFVFGEIRKNELTKTGDRPETTPLGIFQYLLAHLNVQKHYTDMGISVTFI